MVQYTVDAADKNKLAREELEKVVQSTRDSLKEGETSVKSSADGGGGSVRMSTDDADEESKRAKSTRGRWMGGMGPSARNKQ